MFYVYILKLNNGTYYAGFTTNLKERIIDHNKGDVSHTKKFRPVKLVWYSAFVSKKNALEFERYLKSGSGIAFRNKRLI